MAGIDSVFHFTRTTNSEIACDWFKHGIEAGYKENEFESELEAFLIKVGRRKFLEPLYKRLAVHNMNLGRSIFEKAKNGYHAVSRNTIQELLYK